MADPEARPGRGNGQTRATIGFVGDAGSATDHVPEAFFLNGVRCGHP